MKQPFCFYTSLFGRTIHLECGHRHGVEIGREVDDRGQRVKLPSLHPEACPSPPQIKHRSPLCTAVYTCKEIPPAAVTGGKDDLSLHLWKEPVMTSGWARTRASEHWARGTGASNCPYRVTANLFNAWHTVTSLQKVFSWKCSWFKGRDVKGREK